MQQSDEGLPMRVAATSLGFTVVGLDPAAAEKEMLRQQQVDGRKLVGGAGKKPLPLSVLFLKT